jgi:hypothetical protein
VPLLGGGSTQSLTSGPCSYPAQAPAWATGWQPSPDELAEAVLDLYRRETAASDAVLAGLSLDAPPARWPDYFSGWRLRDVREIILHVITETAVHAGHLDAARELLDGRTWLGPEDTRIPRG